MECFSVILIFNSVSHPEAWTFVCVNHPDFNDIAREIYQKKVLFSMMYRRPNIAKGTTDPRVKRFAIEVVRSTTITCKEADSLIKI